MIEQPETTYMTISIEDLQYASPSPIRWAASTRLVSSPSDLRPVPSAESMRKRRDRKVADLITERR